MRGCLELPIQTAARLYSWKLQERLESSRPKVVPPSFENVFSNVLTQDAKDSSLVIRKVKSKASGSDRLFFERPHDSPLQLGWRRIRSVGLHGVCDGEQARAVRSLPGLFELGLSDLPVAKQGNNVGLKDVGVSGIHLDAGASPLLAATMERAASLIMDPTNNVPLNQLFKFRAAPRGDLQVLGSGSDYTSFIDNLGIPSCDYGFVDPFALGEYHSAYDDFYWFRFALRF